MKADFSRRARREADEALDYLLERSPIAADSFEHDLRRTIGILGDFANTGIAVAESQMRVCNLATFPYRIFYRVEESRIFIVSVFHMSRNPDEKPSG